MTLDSHLNAINGVFVPARLHLRLPGNADDFLVNATAETDATIVHETIHFLQTLMSGYGQIAWQTFYQATSFLVSEWTEMTSPTPTERRLPLGYLSQQSALHRLRSTVLYGTVDHMISLANARHYSGGVRTIAQLNIPMYRDPWPIAPTLQISGLDYAIEGRDILESHAAYLESVYSMIGHGIPFEKTFDRSLLPKRYWAAFDYFVGAVGQARQHEFPFVCDLALQTSWPVLIESESEWRDSHPGWRFVALTAAAVALDPSEYLTAQSEDIADRYQTYATKLLQSCNYPTLRVILDERKLQYTRLQGRTLFQQMMLEALEYREDRPTVLANPFVAEGVWEDVATRFQPPLVQVGPRLHLRPPQPGDASAVRERKQKLLDETLAELQFQAFAMQIFGDFRPVVKASGEMQCGYGFFGIDEGCSYQVDQHCPARFNPKAGPPFPLAIDKDEMTGCPFEMMMYAMNMTTRDLALSHGHAPPVLPSREDP